MNPRLTKEFRPLLFPWCVCAFAALGHIVPHLPIVGSGLTEFIAGFSFYAGCLMLAVIPFGSEFQHRTLSLLLGQPIERSRLWKEKFFAATTAVLALIFVHALFAYLATKPSSLEEALSPLSDALPIVGFIVATICSAGFFSLTGRSAMGGMSIIGGMVFTAGAQFAVFGIVSAAIYLGYKVTGHDPAALDLNKFPLLTAYVCTTVAYSAFSLWLGRHEFMTMEAREGTPSRDIALPAWMTPGKLSALLRPEPLGGLQNLIRKEIALQKPILTIAAVSIAGWCVPLLLYFINPANQHTYAGILTGLTFVYIATIGLLAGCVSLGDEKSLGIAAWHLTLPASSRRQWAVKFLVSAATGILVGLVVPLLFLFLSLIKDEVGLVALPDASVHGLWIPIVPLCVLVVLGFWCASFWENTARAALATIVSLIGIGTFAQLGAWMALEYSPGLQSIFVGGLSGHEAVIPYAIVLVILVVTFIALVQSLAQFRRARSSNVIMLKYSLVLAAITFVGAFWCADLAKSLQARDEIHSLPRPLHHSEKKI